MKGYDELIYYEFKPVRIPETGMMYEDWNCCDSFKIYVTDFDALLFKTIDSVFPVNDPGGYGVQKSFDKCSNNFFSIGLGDDKEISEWIESIENSVPNRDVVGAIMAGPNATIDDIMQRLYTSNVIQL